MMLKTVPIPGFCFRKNHRLRVQTLTIKVTTPIDRSTFNEIPLRLVGSEMCIRDSSPNLLIKLQTLPLAIFQSMYLVLQKQK